MIKLRSIFKIRLARTVRGIYHQLDVKEIRNKEFNSKIEAINYINDTIIPKIEELCAPYDAITNTIFEICERFTLDDDVYY